MPFEIIRNDITKLSVDAIVNSANTKLFGGGGVDGAIHRAAGFKLKLECIKIGGCKVGQAKITNGYKLPAKFVIHTVGPIWQGGNSGEEELLRNCYKNSLNLAKERNIKSIAFPLISTGAYSYPTEKALDIAKSEIENFLLNNEMQVYLVVFDKNSFRVSNKLLNDVKSYIDDNYVDKNFLPRSLSIDNAREEVTENRCFRLGDTQKIEFQKSLRNLDDVLNQIGETFSESLLRLIDEKGKTDVETYKKANIDRKLFSKIRGNKDYKPSKPKAIALSIALELNLDETKDFIGKAGYALSNSNKFDLIIEYFIINENYNIYEINETLFAFDQILLSV